VIKHIIHLLLIVGSISCVEIKSMDYIDSLNFDFLSTILRCIGILETINPVNSNIPMIRNGQIKQEPIIQRKKLLPYLSIVHNEDGTSTVSFVFDESSTRKIDVCGEGQLFLHQDKDRIQGLIEIRTITKNIKDFGLLAPHSSAGNTVIIDPKISGDTANYSCSIYAKRIPALFLNDKVGAILATDIILKHLVFKLRNEARVLESDKRIKVQLLRVYAFDDTKITLLQGVATCQELHLSGKAQYTSQLKSGWVSIDACGRSKAHIFFQKDLKCPGSVEGALYDISELRYSGAPAISNLQRSSASLLKRIEK